jgi:hypothetical protein
MGDTNRQQGGLISLLIIIMGDTNKQQGDLISLLIIVMGDTNRQQGDVISLLIIIMGDTKRQQGDLISLLIIIMGDTNRQQGDLISLLIIIMGHTNRQQGDLATSSPSYGQTLVSFKIRNLKFKVLKILNITTCFYQYGLHQVLKSNAGNCCYSAVVTCVLLMCMCVCNMREDFY